MLRLPTPNNISLVPITLMFLITVSLLIPVQSDVEGISFSTTIGGEGNDSANDVAIKSNGNIVVLGTSDNLDYSDANIYSTEDAGLRDVFVNEYSTSGTLISKTIIGGNDTDRASEILVDNEDNVIIIGETESRDFPIINSDIPRPYSDELWYSAIYLVKFSPTNELLWSILIGGPKTDDFVAADLDSYGNIILCIDSSYEFEVINGGLPSNQQGGKKEILFRISPDGEIVWISYLNLNPFHVSEIAIDIENNFYVVGGIFFHSFSGTRPTENQDTPFIIKYSPSGVELWNRVEIGSNADGAVDISIDPSDGNLVVAGYIEPLAIHSISDENNTNGYLKKLTPTGDEQWSILWDDTQLFPIRSIEIDNQGNIFPISIYQDLNASDVLASRDVITLQYTPQGRIVGKGIIGGSDTDFLSGSAMDSSGKIYLVGTTKSDDFPIVGGEMIQSAQNAFLTIITRDLISQETETSVNRISLTFIPLASSLIAIILFRISTISPSKNK